MMKVPILAEVDFSQVIFILIFLLVAFFQWLGGLIKKRRGGGEDLEEEELARFFEELDERTTPPEEGVPRPPARPRPPTPRRPAVARELAPPPLPAAPRARERDRGEEIDAGDFVVRRGERSRRAMEGDEAVDPLARFRRSEESPVLTAQEAAALRRLEGQTGEMDEGPSPYDLEETNYDKVGGPQRRRRAGGFMDLIASPTAARDAIILKEIFDRPLALRREEEAFDRA